MLLKLKKSINMFFIINSILLLFFMVLSNLIIIFKVARYKGILFFIFTLIVFGIILININRLKRYLKTIENKKYLFLLIIISLILRIGWTYYIDNKPISDFKILLNTAIEYNLGNKNIYNETPYFIYWNYQIPFSLYEAFILKIVNSLKFLEIINCILMSLSIIPFFLIVKEIYDEETSKIISLFLILYPPYYYYCAILTNQILPIFFTLWSIYLFLKNKYLWSGIILGISNLFRPIAIVLLIAFIVEKFLDLIFNFDKKKFFDI